jgi:hypothetical protein
MFPLVALGPGPVRPDGPWDLHGVINAGNTGDAWYSFKNEWQADATYDGPFRVRGARIDGPGDMGFGLRPDTSELLVPAGPTQTVADGYRWAPGAMFVTAAGCWAFQVDGTTFFSVMVFQLRVS